MSEVAVKIYSNYTRFAFKNAGQQVFRITGMTCLWGGNAIIHATVKTKKGKR